MPTHDPRPRTERRQQRRRFRRRAGSGFVAGSVAVGGLIAAFSLGGDEAKKVATPDPTTTTTTTAPRYLGPPYTVAASAVLLLNVYESPSESAPVVATLGAETDYTIRTNLLVDQVQTDPAPGWVPVLVPFQKPNATSGWVPESQVTLSQTNYEIVVELSTRELVVLEGGTPILSTKVIIGTPETPTPTGRFYITDPVNCNTVKVDAWPVASCSEAYGEFAIGTSGLSDALDSFAGTIPQIAIHGTFLPESELGKELSNGCIRIPNDIVLQIAALTPLLGTPVTVK